MQMRRVITADVRRWFFRKKFFFIILLVIAVDYMIMTQTVFDISSSDVIRNMEECESSPFFSVNYMLIACLFSASFTEEKEQGCLNFCLIRSSLKNYVVSKVLNSFLSAFIAMFCGTFLWGISMRLFLPWADYTQQWGDQFAIYCTWGLGGLLSGHHFLQYYLLECMGLGMLGGLLATAAFLCSLFVKTELLPQIIPPVLLYLANSYCADLSPLLYDYSPSTMLFFPDHSYEPAVKTVLQGTVYTFLLVALLGILCYLILYHKQRKGVL